MEGMGEGRGRERKGIGWVMYREKRKGLMGRVCKEEKVKSRALSKEIRWASERASRTGRRACMAYPIQPFEKYRNYSRRKKKEPAKRVGSVDIMSNLTMSLTTDWEREVLL